MQNHIDLTGKRALIVGAGAGVGRAVAIRLAGEGMKVALVDGDAAALMRTAALTGRPFSMLSLFYSGRLSPRFSSHPTITFL